MVVSQKYPMRQQYQSADCLNQSPDCKETAALLQVSAAECEAELSDAARARQGVTADLALSPGRDMKVAAAPALARTGDAPRAQTLDEELAKTHTAATNTLASRAA